MHRNPLRTLAVAAVVGCGLSGVASVADASARRPSSGDGTLAIASLAPETGALQSLRESLRLPVELAVSEINAAGGVNGAAVSLGTGDEGSDVATARATVSAFADAGVDAVIGPASPATVLGVLGDVRKARMLMCSGSDTLAPVTARSSKGLYFRTAPGPRLQGLALAAHVRADDHKRVAILRRNDFFGDDVGAAARRGLRKGDVKVVADIVYDPDAGSVNKKVRAALQPKPKAVVVVGFDDDGARVVASLIAQGAGPDTIAIYGPDTMQSLDFAAAVDPTDPAHVAGIKGVAPAPAPGNVTSPFHAALVNRGTAPIFSSHSYDCTILAALASVKAKSDDPDAMKTAFAKNLKGKSDCNTFAACKALLEEGRSIHWRGASSDFDHFSGFEPGSGTFDTWAYDASGQLVAGPPTDQIRVP
ncbi:MAG: ABC transporter substrate-binding protein [Acidimicrobiia bacterium]